MIFPLLIIITIISLLLYVVPNLEYYTVNAEIEKKFSTYENLIFKIKIDFPSDWILQQYVIPGNIVIFHDPPTKINRTIFDRSFSSFNLDIGFNSFYSFSNISLGIFIQNLTDLFPNHYNISLALYNFLEFENLQKDPSVRVIKVEEGRLSEEPAYKIDYKKFRNHYTKIWTINDNIVYIIFYAYNPNADIELQNTLQKMINSFKFIKDRD